VVTNQSVAEEDGSEVSKNSVNVEHWCRSKSFRDQVEIMGNAGPTARIDNTLEKAHQGAGKKNNVFVFPEEIRSMGRGERGGEPMPFETPKKQQISCKLR
jgi:hypothetical protein